MSELWGIAFPAWLRYKDRLTGLSLRKSRSASRAVVLLLIVLSGGDLAADFDLPILSPIPKILSVTDDYSPSDLERFVEVRDLTIEIRTTRGNLLSETLHGNLNKKYAKVPKCIVLGGSLKAIHVEQLRRLSGFDVRFEAGTAGPSPEAVNALHALGPVRKTVVLDASFTRENLDRIRQLKFFVPAVRLESEMLSKDQLSWLREERNHRKLFLLPRNFNPDWLYDLAGVSPLGLEIQTTRNRIEPKTLRILRDLKKAELTLVVDGSLTLEDVRQFTQLEQFSLKVVLDPGAQMIPGLAQLLNQIAPP